MSEEWDRLVELARNPKQQRQTPSAPITPVALGVVLNKVVFGDCVEVLKKLPSNSIDSIVTDPPYGLEFMGKEWDKLTRNCMTPQSEADQKWNAEHDKSQLARRMRDRPDLGATAKYATEIQEWHKAWATEALRILKPGGYLLSFGGSRTYHRMACAVEDAGFEVRDMIEWVYGSGFPKSHNIHKANEQCPEGWGTALKPAHEPICMARKPLAEKTVAENCLKWGTGGINIDGCRVGTGDNLNGGAYSNNRETSTNKIYGEYQRIKEDYQQPQGRFPANLIHDGSEEVRECFPDSKSTGGTNPANQNQIYGKRQSVEFFNYGDAGNASRFFYCAKASKSERNAGLDGFEEKPIAWGNQAKAELKRGNLDFKADGDATKHNKVEMRINNHATVKPIALMEYLVRLVTPPKGVVLDPFMGSGTTGIAAIKQGFEFIGIEKEADYLKIAEARIKHYSAQQKQEAGGK